MVAIFNETEYPTGLDVDALTRIAKYFNDLAPRMMPSHGHVSIIDPGILIHQIPGGMISNLRSQLAQQKALDRLDEVLAEVPKVRADIGYPPLVTPTSQIVGTQAVMNVITGTRYSIVPNEVKNYVKGLYGRPPGPIDPSLVKLILGREKPVTHRPADDLEPMLPRAIENLDSRLIEHEEDIISYCLFPEQALEYFRWRKLPAEKRPAPPVELELKGTSAAAPAAAQPESARVTMPSQPPLMSREDYREIGDLLTRAAQLNITELVIRKGDAGISLKAESPASTVSAPVTTESSRAMTAAAVSPPRGSGTEPAESVRESTSPEEKGTVITSPLVGKFYTAPAPSKPSFVHIGDRVKAGTTLCIVEAMKLINEIKAPRDSVILKVLAVDGESVEKGHPLMIVREGD